MSDAKPLKVLHIYRTYFPDTQGGGEEVIRQICLNTRPHGVESRVFSLSPKPSPTPLVRPEGTVYQAQQHLEVASCGMSFSSCKGFRQQAAWADVLHYHFPWPFGDVLHLFNPGVTAKPTAICYHSDVVRQKMLFKLYKPLMHRFLARVDRLVVSSPNYAASSALLQEYRDRVAVIPIGINEDQYPAPNPQAVADFRRRFSSNFLFFVGVFRYYKGLRFLLEAARNTQAPIVIAGTGPEEETLKAFAREHQLSHVYFLGRISDGDKINLLAASRAMVFPSHLPSESFGIALLEAAMLAKPMISCEIGTGTSFVNQHNHTGLVIPPADPEALATAIDTLAADADLAARLGANARQRYETLFTGEIMGRQYADLYRQMLADNPRTQVAGQQ